MLSVLGLYFDSTLDFHLKCKPRIGALLTGFRVQDINSWPVVGGVWRRDRATESQEAAGLQRLQVVPGECVSGHQRPRGQARDVRDGERETVSLTHMPG